MDNKIWDENGKICSKCKIYKPWSEFHTANASSTGHTPECKKCKTRGKKYKHIPDDYVKDESRKDNLVGKKFSMLLVLEQAPNNKRNRRWKCKCDCGNETIVQTSFLKTGYTRSCGCLKKNPHNKEQDRYEYLRYKHFCRSVVNRSKNGIKLDYDITVEDFCKMTEKNCYYCGCEPSSTLTDHITAKDGKTVFVSDLKIKYNGLDRIDSDKGYLKDNVVTCCRKCNTMKMDTTKEVFLQKIIDIYNNLNLKELNNAA